MATATVRRQGLQQRTIRAVLLAPRGGTARDMWARGQRVLAVAKRRVGVDTGALRADLKVERLPAPLFPGVRVGSNLPHAWVHHQGRGVVRPVRARVLRFVPKGSTKAVFTMHARAVGPNPYLRDALPAARRR
jgi:hypothetical protein